MTRHGAATARPTPPRPSQETVPSRSARPTQPRPRLTVVPPLRSGAPRAPFVLLVGALLTAGLAGLLFLYTALAEDSFRLHDLQERSSLLADREQGLQQQVSAAASPQRLAARAKALGMVRSENPAFIRLADGRILGKPKAGKRPPMRATPVPGGHASAGHGRAAAGRHGRHGTLLSPALPDHPGITPTAPGLSVASSRRGASARPNR